MNGRTIYGLSALRYILHRAAHALRGRSGCWRCLPTVTVWITADTRPLERALREVQDAISGLRVTSSYRESSTGSRHW